MVNELKTHQINTVNLKGFCSLEDLKNYTKSNGKPTFLDFWKEEMEASSLRESSKKMHRVTLAKLREYRKTIFFHDLTYSSIDSFDKYIKRENFSDVTIEKYHKHIKRYINIAVKKDYLAQQRTRTRSSKLNLVNLNPGNF